MRLWRWFWSPAENFPKGCVVMFYVIGFMSGVRVLGIWQP